MPWKSPEARRNYYRAYMREYLKDPVRYATALKCAKESFAKNARACKRLIAQFKSNGCSNCPRKRPSLLNGSPPGPGWKTVSYK